MENSVNVRCVRVTRGSLIGGHVGPWAARPYPAFVLIRSGEVVTEFGPGRGPSALQRGAGRVVWYPTQRMRRVRVVSSEPAGYTAAVVSFAIFPGVDLLEYLDLPFLIPEEHSAPFEGVLECLADLHEAPGVPSLLRGVRQQELCCRLLAHVLTIAPLSDDASRRLAGRSRLAPALEYLDRHFHESFRIPDLAESVCLSVVQFHRRFKALTGITPFEYAKRLRLQMASALLLDSDLSVAEIGARVGWDDPFHFSKVFRAAQGVPPTVFRREGETVV